MCDVNFAGEKFVVWNRLDASSFCELGRHCIYAYTSYVYVNVNVQWLSAEGNSLARCGWKIKHCIARNN